MRLVFFNIVAILSISASLLFAGDYDFQRNFAKKWHINENDVIVLENPIGSIHLTNTATELGAFVNIRQTIFASFDELAQSRQMVMMVRIADTRGPDTLFLRVQFPFHIHEKYCYPDMGGFFTSSIEGIWNGKKITVSPKGGAKLWSDIFLEIPAGHKVIIKSIATTFIIEDYIGDIDFATDHASAMTAGDIRGNLFLTSCHGALSVSKFEGELFYDGEDSDITFCDAIKGTVHAKSTTGDIIWNAKCDSVDLVEIESISGKIMFKGELANFTHLINDEGDIEIEPTTHAIDSLVASVKSGDIELTMQENFAHDIIAMTEEGKVSHKLPVTEKCLIQATLKGTSGRVILLSTKGDIDINLKSIE